MAGEDFRRQTRDCQRSRPGSAADHSRLTEHIAGDQRDKSGYYQLAFNAIGSMFDAKGRDDKYNNDEWRVNGWIGADSWKIIVKWPLASFGRNITMNNRFGMMIYRNTGNSTWMGINVHEPSGFNDLVLKMD